MGLIPGHGGRISMGAECKSMHVLRFRCTSKNLQMVKINLEHSTEVSFITHGAVWDIQFHNFFFLWVV